MWKRLASKIVHKNPWWQVRCDDFSLPSGKRGKYYVLETRGSVYIIALKDAKILFENQYRYPINAWGIELPGGQWHADLGAAASARLELREELGYTAKSLKKIGSFIPFNGVSNERCTVFIADGLKFVGEEKEETEEIQTLEIDPQEAYRMAEDGRITDGMTLAALAIARPYIFKKSLRQ